MARRFRKPRTARFRTPRRRETPARRSWWSRWGWLALVAVLVIAWWVGDRRTNPPATWEPVTQSFRLCGERGSGPCVIDGDTLAIGPRRIRLTGFDTPEMDGACDNERHKARMARDRLARWLRQGPFEWTGGASPPYDRYGRELREARRGEERLAEVMVREGLAEDDGWGADRVEWC